MSSIVTPEGYRLHCENGAKLLLPASNEAFLNPVQEFNRDLSVASIRVWSEQFNEIKEKRWDDKRKRKGQGATQQPEPKRKKGVIYYFQTSPHPLVHSLVNIAFENLGSGETISNGRGAPDEGDRDDTIESSYVPHKVVILEPLSATGLRSIRYAQEIPLVKYVIANDLSPSATEIMKRNVLFNELGPQDPPKATGPEEENTTSSTPTRIPKGPSLGKVRVNEGDACSLMYAHRAERQRVDVVDLDPYGTAAPFLDAAVQCVNDGGLLCVTCTDLSVLGNTNYPEKCFANYGGVPVKAEYCHEVALRLVLHAISTSAARYGRYIHPVLSLSIDFYVRVFVRVHAAPIEVKKAYSKTSVYYVCAGCQSFHAQPLGKIVEKTTESSSHVNLQYKTHAGPPVSQHCDECGGMFHVAGPMWSGSLHDKDFTGRLLRHIESEEAKYGTCSRMKGMITLADQELDTPFYFTPSRVAGFFHSTCPSLDQVASALLHNGFLVRTVIHDIFRCHVKDHPVKMENIKDGSPATALLSKTASFEANFKRHPDVSALSNVKLVRYQQNPTAHWGPGAKAQPGPGGGKKRKRDRGDE
ncbi:N2,N2-dimethylguanosine tRNA methyltransferase [Gautieria morchelliformis]|nr:N2,N2-dimethylguanosine tRNA methyltransferase [Gautieria morchelliformis]